MASEHVEELVVVLGDQLSSGLSALRAARKSAALVLMAELYDETHYAPHHQKKIAFVFSAMRHFNAELQEAGWRTEYMHYGTENTIRSFAELIQQAITQYQPKRIYLTEPNEYRSARTIQRVDYRLPGAHGNIAR